MARERFPFLPVEPLLKYPFKSYEFLQKAKSQISIIHGDQDRVVPISSAYKLYQSLKGQKVEFIEIEGGSHNDLASFEKYQATIKELLLPEFRLE